MMYGDSNGFRKFNVLGVMNNSAGFIKVLQAMYRLWDEIKDCSVQARVEYGVELKSVEVFKQTFERGYQCA